MSNRRELPLPDENLDTQITQSLSDIGLKILEKYHKEVPFALTRHHIDSYEQCVFEEIPSIIHSFNPIVLLKGPLDKEQGIFETRVEVFMGGNVATPQELAIQLASPIVSLDGGHTIRRLFPNEARLRNMTYAVQVSIDIQVKITITRKADNGTFEAALLDVPIIKSFPLFSLPILLRSKLCVTGGVMNRIRDMEMGECRNDYGGYFIIGGSEKILITRSEQAFNSLYVEKRPPADLKISAYASVVSLNPDNKQTRRVALYLLREKPAHPPRRPYIVPACIRIAVPMIRGTFPLFILFRAMGVESDEEIVRRIFPDPSDPLQDLLIPSIEDAYPIYNRFMAIKYIMSLTKGFSEAHVMDILHNLMLPHVPDEPLARVQYLAEMTRELLRAEAGQRGKTDRDDMRNQKFLPTGTLLRELFNGCWKDWRAATTLAMDRLYNSNTQLYKGEDIKNLFAPSNLIGLFKPADLNKGIMRGFRGKWGSNPMNEKVGVLQPLARISYLDAESHTRRVVADFDTGMKLTGPRKLHTSQVGYFCTSETPTGAHIGVTKNMSMMTQYSIGAPVKPVYDWLKSKGGLISVSDTTAPLRVIAAVVQINGGTVGFTVNPQRMVRVLRLLKWTGCLSPSASISFNTTDKTVRILLDEGRPIRPLWHLTPGMLGRLNELLSHSWNQLVFGRLPQSADAHKSGMRTTRFIDPLASVPTASFDDYEELLAPAVGSIEYCDPHESNEAYISWWGTPDEIMNDDNRFTHAEIHPSTLTGLLASMIPYSNHNQAPRNQLSNSQSKQGIGSTVTNLTDRYDTYSHQLCYGQAPLCTTFTYDTIGCGEMPYGFNCIIAATSETGYNQDDGLIINRDSVARGMFQSLSFRSYDCAEETDPITKVHSHISNPGMVSAWNSLKPGLDYSRLDERGIIRVGEIVDDHTVLVGRYMVIPATNEVKDDSITPGLFTGGRVDSVVVLHQNEGMLVKIRIIEMRIPELGDKFSSRHGQKGTIGMLVNSTDLPRTADGLVPDVMVNPGGLISRMTVAQLVEMIAGRVSVEVASKINATTFCNGPEFVGQLGAVLTSLGVHPGGDTLLYSGLTGVQLPTAIFMCPLYFMRLKHLTGDKLNARAAGRREVRTHQPTGGRSNEGGLRIGEMERDSLCAHGVSCVIQESMMKRGDATTFLICKGCGRIPIFNESEQLYVCSTCDGPLTYSGLTPETLRLQLPTKQSRTTFTHISIPYALKLLDQELTTFGNMGLRFITEGSISRLRESAEDGWVWPSIDVDFKEVDAIPTDKVEVNPEAAAAAKEEMAPKRKGKGKTQGTGTGTIATNTVTLPANQVADKEVVDDAMAVRFSNKLENEFKGFNNFAPAAFRVSGAQIPAPDGTQYPEIGAGADGSIDPGKQTWPSVEHFFQAMKFPGDPAWQETIRTASSPVIARAKALDRAHPKRGDWDAINERVMKQGIKAKFEQNPELLALLLSTGDRKLLEASTTDDIWGIGRTGKGENKMGKLLMEVRQELTGARPDLRMASTRSTESREEIEARNAPPITLEGIAQEAQETVNEAVGDVIKLISPAQQGGGGANQQGGGGGAGGQQGGVYLFINPGGGGEPKARKGRDRGWGRNLNWSDHTQSGGGGNSGGSIQNDASEVTGGGSEVTVEKLGA